MEPIKAFVAHSFTDDDSDVVKVILRCLNRVAELNPRFSWQDAEHPEPRLVDAKVLSLFADKNLFIGICTRKERVVSPSALSSGFFARGSLLAKESEFHWKTSDWIIQEIGLAIGRDMKIILLVEEGIKSPGSLQGNLEYIEFNRKAPEKCFDALLGMIAALSPPVTSTQAVSQEATPLEEPEREAIPPSGEDGWMEPKPEWETLDYELALLRCILRKNDAAERRIEEQFFATEDGKDAKKRLEWAARAESLRITFGRGDLAKLESLAADAPDSSSIAEHLALGYLHYEEFEKAANAYELAANKAENPKREIELLGDSAYYHVKAGNDSLARALEDRMRLRSEKTGQGEVQFLEAEKKLAAERKEPELELAALERLIEISPGDIETRFSLAFRNSAVGRDDLAAFHYSRIPAQSRNGNAWNNLGVALERLDMPIQAVAAYRESEKLGETLAMSNLAVQFLRAGFLPETQELLDTAFKIENHHSNIDRNLGTLKDAQEAESKKEAASHSKAKAVSDYYRQFGRALAKTPNPSISGHWKGPDCVLEFAVLDSSMAAVGSYEVARGLLFSLAATGQSNPSPQRYSIKYTGSIRGLTIVGSVLRRNEADPPALPTTLLDIDEATPAFLMWVDSSGDTIHVLERTKNRDPRHYDLHRV